MEFSKQNPHNFSDKPKEHITFMQAFDFFRILSKGEKNGAMFKKWYELLPEANYM